MNPPLPLKIVTSTESPVYIGPSDLEKLSLAFYQLQCSLVVFKVAFLSEVGVNFDVESFQAVSEDACSILRAGWDLWSLLLDNGYSVIGTLFNTIAGVASGASSVVNWGWSIVRGFQYEFDVV